MKGKEKLEIFGGCVIIIVIMFILFCAISFDLRGKWNLTSNKNEKTEWECIETQLDCLEGNPNYDKDGDGIITVPDECYSCKDIHQIDENKYYCLDEGYTIYVNCIKWRWIKKRGFTLS